MTGWGTGSFIGKSQHKNHGIESTGGYSFTVIRYRIGDPLFRKGDLPATPVRQRSDKIYLFGRNL